MSERKSLLPMIAHELGVEIWEEFNVQDIRDGRKFPDRCRFSDFCMQFWHAEEWMRGDAILSQLLCGNYQVVKKPWKPKDGEMFYWCKFINGALYVVGRFFNTAAGGDIACYRLGNCYPTKEAAEADREKWERFYATDDPIDWEEQK